MSKVKDLTGQKFGRLQVMHRNGSNHRSRAVWRCKCDCGEEITVDGYSLSSGHSSSCGCRRKDTLHRLNKKPWNKRTRTTWRNMISRCYNEHNPRYKDYGGRGIKVCDRWHNFKNFYADMGGASKDKTLDRIDTNGDYAPENCRWATQSLQTVNSRKRKDSKNSYRNIGYHVQTGKWRLRLYRDKKKYDLGLFSDINDALVARDSFKTERGELIYD